MEKKIVLVLIFVFFAVVLPAQNGFVRASGKQIVDGNGNNLILKGIGTGNWMLQEGYMMQTSGIAGTHWEFKKKLTETIGVEKTNQFYTAWFNNHFRKIDVDSMARWGFNCVRPALHYKNFTLPIEEEPVSGVNTWLDDGFTRLDSLMAWCAANKMYVVLDMHGAPGGQGKDAAISDYNPAKPSLWESEENKSKFVALWRKIAQRYATNQWIAGYDLLNETNWSFPGGNNSPLRELYVRTTQAIREVDPNHLIFIEGNWFANDFSGLTPPWDSNMAYSFHKYWTNNDVSVIKWVLDLRNQTNCPIWLGESGENSNRWFTDCIELLEKNNIGWSWWPVKKPGINNILKSTINPDYTELINYWKGNAPKPSVDQAFQAVMTFAENHKLENCVVQHDVIDALIRQPHTTETIPYKQHSTSGIIYAVDYDYGRAGYAYSDSLDANYHLNTNNYTAWNNGYLYRNDGVDIEKCTDDQTNGYQVGWIEKGDWMQYTLRADATMAYTILLRYASQAGNAKVFVEVNGKRASRTVALAATGGWANWRTGAVTNVIVPEGNAKVRIVFEQGGVNFNYFELRNPKAVENTAFEMLSAETDAWADRLTLKFNKSIDPFTGHPFSVTIDGKAATILSTAISTTDNSRVDIQLAETVLFSSKLKITYTSTVCKSGAQSLNWFQDYEVSNLTIPHHTIPGKIEAEKFTYNNGFSFETCTDAGGGINTSYAAVDKYLDYFVWVQNSGSYVLDFRVSVNTPSAQLAVLKDQNGSMVPLKTISLTGTGGWQNWQTQSTTVSLTAGKNILRVLSRSDGYNLNWIQFSQVTPAKEPKKTNFTVYPNPTRDYFILQFADEQMRSIELIDSIGHVVTKTRQERQIFKLDVQDQKPGIYFLRISDRKNSDTQKIQIL